MASESEEVLTKLKELEDEVSSIKMEVEYMKKYAVDYDVVLTDDDLESITEAEKDLKEGKIKRLI